MRKLDKIALNRFLNTLVLLLQHAFNSLCLDILLVAKFMRLAVPLSHLFAHLHCYYWRNCSVFF